MPQSHKMLRPGFDKCPEADRVLFSVRLVLLYISRWQVHGFNKIFEKTRVNFYRITVI